MSQIVTRLFDSYAGAESAVRELEAAGIPHHDISLVANDDVARRGAPARDGDNLRKDEATAHDAREGAGVGGALGGVAGLLAGLGVLAIPGIGPVVAAGWVVSTIGGAVVGAAVGGAAGGLVGSLTHAGVPEADANVYAEGVRRGGTLVSVKAHDDRAAAVAAILDRYSGVDAAARGAEYRAAGWTAFDPAAAPYEVTTRPL